MYRKDIRPEIVESFITEFNLHGPKLTLDQVSSRIHISKKTIYRFFRSKDDIYAYILKDACATIHAQQEKIYNDPTMGTVEKLKAILTIKTSWEEKIDLSSVALLSEDSPSVFRSILSAYEDSWDYIAKLVEQGKAEGVVRPETNTVLLIAYIRASMESLYDNRVLADSHMTYTQAIRQLSTIALNGILK